MGRAILCLGSVAKTPYELHKLGIHIYSVEELCFCIRENAVLMDEEMVCRELIDWLREECGLTELADSLYGFLKTRASVGAFFGTILDYAGYYPQEENRRIERFLKESANLGPREKKKTAADYLAERGRYQAALQEYYRLLDSAGEDDPVFRGKICHNIGYVCGQMFSFEKAAGFFKKAYEYTGDQRSLGQYLAALRFWLGEERYIEFVASHEMLQEASISLEKELLQLGRDWEESPGKRESDLLKKELAKEPETARTRLEEAGEEIKEKYRLAVRI